jgi:hypothetical protein
VQVERKPVDRPVAAGDALFQDHVIEAEERAEEAVVGKETRVKEELTLRKTAADRTQDISDTPEVEIQDERGGRGTLGASADVGGQIAEHMDVIASDGVKIGTMDHLDGPEKIKLAKSTSPDGQHHFIPLTWVDHVDTHVHLTQPSAEARAGGRLPVTPGNERSQGSFRGGPNTAPARGAGDDRQANGTGKVSVVTLTETVEEVVPAVLKGEEAEVVTVELDQPVNGPAPRIPNRGWRHHHTGAGGGSRGKEPRA